MTTLIESAAELRDSGLSLAKIKATLIIDDHKQSDIAKALKELGIISERKVTFRDIWYDFIVESEPTLAEAGEFVDTWCEENPEIASNIARNKKAFLKDADLAIRIRASLAE